VGASVRELAELNGLLASVVDRRLPLAPAFKLLAGLVRSLELRDVLNGVSQGLEDGQALHEAMGRFPKTFPPDYCSLVRAGTDGDRLAEVFRTYQTYQGLRARLRRKVLRIGIYILSGVLIGELALGFNVTAGRHLTEIVNQMRAQLELKEGFFLDPEHVYQGGLLLMAALPLGLLLAIAAYWLVQRRAGMGWIGYATPVLGVVQKSRDLALFCCGVGLRLRSGLPLLDALRAGRDSVGNRYFQRQADHVIERVSEGEPLSSALFYLRFFPRTLSWGVSLGEENAELPRALDTFAQLYTLQMERGFDLLQEFMTPLGILTVGNIAILAAMMMLAPFFTLIRIYQSIY
jgi:type IV pilus assembly protein PilC